MRWLAPIWLLLIGLAATPAAACSVVRGYRTPTNFELVQKASLIVLARVKAGPDEIEGPDPAVVLEPVRVLKGTLPDGEALRVAGSLRWNGDPVPAMPTPLSLAHVSTGIGACIRMVYPKGGLVVAMFGPTSAAIKRDRPVSVMQLSDPFARAVEDVESVDAIWVRAVEAYVALQAGTGKAGLRAAVERERTAMAARTDDMAAQAMAADLAYYLDMSSGATDRTAKRLHWKFLDLPDESAAFMGGPGVKGAILRCRSGGGVVEAYWPPEEGPAQALRIAGAAFALTPASLQLSPDMPARSATLPLDARLAAALRTGTAEAGLVTDKRTITAPPRDILQKLGLRCGALLMAGKS